MRRECLVWTLFVSSRNTVNSRELASKAGGSAPRKIATAPGEERTVRLGEMGRSRSRSKSPSRRRHKSKHSRKRSKSREKHSNNKYSEKPKERSSKSRCVPFAMGEPLHPCTASLGERSRSTVYAAILSRSVRLHLQR